MLGSAISKLSEREQVIVKLRFGINMPEGREKTQKEVADLLGISYETMYKTLVTVGKSKAYYVFVIPIAEEIDFKKAAKSVGEKSLEMLPFKRTHCCDRICARWMHLHWDEEKI